MYITVLNTIKYNVCFLSYIHHTLLGHVSAGYGHHQVSVSPAKIVSLFAVFCVTLLYSMLIFCVDIFKLIFKVFFIEIMKFSLEYDWNISVKAVLSCILCYGMDVMSTVQKCIVLELQKDSFLCGYSRHLKINMLCTLFKINWISVYFLVKR
jgi:hypothetical protein